jgi:hypothetical protein
MLLALATFLLPTRASSAQDVLSKTKQRGELIVGAELQYGSFELLQCRRTRPTHGEGHGDTDR